MLVTPNRTQSTAARGDQYIPAAAGCFSCNLVAGMTRRSTSGRSDRGTDDLVNPKRLCAFWRCRQRVYAHHGQRPDGVGQQEAFDEVT
jgi:hypothetical protein